MFLLFLAGLGILSLVGLYFFASRKNKQLCEYQPDTLSFTWLFFLGALSALTGIVISIVGIAIPFLDYLSFSSRHFPFGVTISIFGLSTFYIGLSILQLKRWGIIFYTVLSLNPLLWIINFIYIKNRWSELAIENYKGLTYSQFLKNFFLIVLSFVLVVWLPFVVDDRLPIRALPFISIISIVVTLFVLSASYFLLKWRDTSSMDTSLTEVESRAAKFVSVIWGVAVIAFALIFDFFGYRVSGEEVFQLVLIIIGPIISVFAIYLGWTRYVIKSDS